MLAIISPAKTLDFDSPAAIDTATQPALLERAAELVEVMRQYGPDDLVKLMGVSDKIALLNVQRYLNWRRPFTAENAKQAILAFKGDVYSGLNAEQFSCRDFDFAQRHLRILSGLYGLLRPLDLMQPYRLEMGTRLATERGDNLYHYWGAQLSESVNRQLEDISSDVVINLASNEYFKALDRSQLQARIITPVFKDWKNGKYKIVSFYAKKARGLMSAYLIQQQLHDAEALQGFNVDGYAFDAASSTADDWVFLRRVEAA